MQELTEVLNRVSKRQLPSDRLLLPIYQELRKLAAARLAEEKPGQTLQATALVHEAYLRLVGNESEVQWNSRGHFFGAAAEAMRRILVENARKKNAVKRAGDRIQITLEEGDAVADDLDDLLALDEALQQLESHDELASRVVKLRYFAGLSMTDTAKALDISKRTAERNWTYAKTWLHARLK